MSSGTSVVYKNISFRKLHYSLQRQEQQRSICQTIEVILMSSKDVHKNWLLLADFFFDFFLNQPKPANFGDSSKTLKIFLNKSWALRVY